MKISRNEFKNALHDPGLYFIQECRNWTMEDVIKGLEIADPGEIEGVARWMECPTSELSFNCKTAAGTPSFLDISDDHKRVEKHKINGRMYYFILIISNYRRTGSFFNIMIYGE